MKKLFVIVLCTLSALVARSEDKSDALKSFYVSYITNADKNQTSANHELLASYLASPLIEKVEKTKEKRNFDPILNAQDTNIKSVETIMVVNVGDDWYCVSYKFNSSETVFILLRVKTKDNSIMIDDIQTCHNLY